MDLSYFSNFSYNGKNTDITTDLLYRKNSDNEKKNLSAKYPEKYSYTGSDICYRDRDGKEYCGKDFFELTRNRESADRLFDMIESVSPNRFLDHSVYFVKCKRCGGVHYYDPFEKMFRHGDKECICSLCTPVRTGGVILLDTDYYGDDRKLFAKSRAVLQPGITTLVGCNGIGKTSFIQAASAYLKKLGQPCILFDNLSENGGQKNVFGSLNRALFGGSKDDLATAAGLFSSSEGEKIGAALISFCKTVKEYADLHKGYGEIWILFDAIDSGLSVNVLSFIKEVILGKIISDLPEGMLPYIIFSCNSWEMAEGTNCFLMEKLNYAKITSYNAFKKAVFSSQEAKDKRDLVFTVKAEIFNRPHTFSFDEEACNGKEPGEKVCAVLEQDGFILELFVKRSKRGSESHRFNLYRNTDGIKKPVKIRDFEFDAMNGFHIRKTELEQEMKECVCRQIFLEKKKNGF